MEVLQPRGNPLSLTTLSTRRRCVFSVSNENKLGLNLCPRKSPALRIYIWGSHVRFFLNDIHWTLLGSLKML